MKRGTVNGWTIVHIADVFEAEGGKLRVQFEHQDARINGANYDAVEALKFAQPNWIFAVKFKNSNILHAIELDRLS